MMSSFHFLHPLWLLALLPLALLIWWMFKVGTAGNAWHKVIDANLLPVLLHGDDSQTGKLAKWLLALGGLVTIIALADPVWEKIPRPIFQTNTARVIVLDLSNSMLIDDLKPTRLARARFKIEDILSSDFLKKQEGQTGLVVFAGDAFVASPLTRDVDTIKSLLKVLTPHLLPSQGSRVDLGLKKAHELLSQAGVRNGYVLLIADGVSDELAALKQVKALKKDSHTISVLGVGTPEGGILPSMRRKKGINITVKLESQALEQLAKQGAGNYHAISSSNADLKQVLKPSLKQKSGADATKSSLSDDLKSEDWKSFGPYLLFLLLPLAALAFRKGWLFNALIVFFVMGFFIQPQTVMAFSFSESWDGLWKNKEQRADKALQQQQFDKATKLTKSPLRKGTAEYKKGDYEKALENFKQAKGADARFNEGNTLAKQKKYQEALKAYQQALKEQPDMVDAKENKKAIEAFLKRQKEKKKQQKEGDKSGKKGDKKNKKDKKEGENKQQSDKDKQSKKDSKDNKQGDNKDEKSSENKGDKSDKKNQFADANKKKDAQDPNKPEDEQDSSTAEKNKEDEKQKEDKSRDNKGSQDKSAQKPSKDKLQAEATDLEKQQANDLSKEEKMAAEQWLRRIPDDPGGLLRRKFQRQYQRQRRRGSMGRVGEEKPW